MRALKIWRTFPQTPILNRLERPRKKQKHCKIPSYPMKTYCIWFIVYAAIDASTLNKLQSRICFYVWLEMHFSWIFYEPFSWDYERTVRIWKIMRILCAALNVILYAGNRWTFYKFCKYTGAAIAAK